MSMFKAQFIFAVGRGVVKNIAVPPQSGIKQGDPLSLAVFVMVCSVLIHALSPHVHILFYADDLLLYIPLPPPHRPTCALLPPIFQHLRQFGIFVGLQINLSKSAFLTKGAWTDQWVTVLKSFGVEVKQKVKYLGIVLGACDQRGGICTSHRQGLAACPFCEPPPADPGRTGGVVPGMGTLLVYLSHEGVLPNGPGSGKNLCDLHKVALRLNSWG